MKGNKKNCIIFTWSPQKTVPQLCLSLAMNIEVTKLFSGSFELPEGTQLQGHIKFLNTGQEAFWVFLFY